jgi:hypothetical protein
VPDLDQVLARAYDHVEVQPIKPVTTLINLFRAVLPAGKTVTAEPARRRGLPFSSGIFALVTYLHCSRVSAYPHERTGQAWPAW